MNFIFKFFKFGIVGLLSAIIDFGVTGLSKEKLHLNKYLANGLGFSISAVFNYYVNRIWTFRNSDPDITSQFITFLIVAIIGLLINSLIVYYLHHKKRINFYLAKIFATGVVVFWNFFMNNLFTFKG